MSILSLNRWYKVHQISKFKCFSSRFAIVFVQSIEARCDVENEDVVGAAPTGDAPTTSEWSTIVLPTKVRLILEVWRYINFQPQEKYLRYWVYSRLSLWNSTVSMCGLHK